MRKGAPGMSAQVMSSRRNVPVDLLPLGLQRRDRTRFGV